MEDPDHKIVIHRDVFVQILIKGWDNTIKNLERRGEFKDLKPEVLNRTSVEFLIFYLFYFDCILNNIFNGQGHNKTLNALQKEVAFKLSERDERYLNENKNRMNFVAAGVYTLKYGLCVNFSGLWNKRIREYSGYKYFFSEEKDGETIEESKINAHSVFSQRIAKLVTGDPEDSFRIMVGMLSNQQIQIYEKELESKGISLRARYKDAVIIESMKELFD